MAQSSLAMLLSVCEALPEFRAIRDVPIRNLTVIDPEMLKIFIRHMYEMPENLKNDITYCRRSIMDHMAVFNKISSTDLAEGIPGAGEQIFTEILNEIAEIEMEIKVLKLELKSNTVEFRNMLTNLGYIVPEFIDIILELNVPKIQWGQIKPINVKLRNSEEIIWERYEILKKKEKYTLLQKVELDTKTVQCNTAKASTSKNFNIEKQEDKKTLKIKTRKVNVKSVKAAEIKAPKTTSAAKTTSQNSSESKTKPFDSNAALNEDLNEITIDPSTQHEFLKIFNLCTHAEMQVFILEQSKPKRKSRSAAKKADSDYVYGSDGSEFEPEPEPKRRRTSLKNKK